MSADALASSRSSDCLRALPRIPQTLTLHRPVPPRLTRIAEDTRRKRRRDGRRRRSELLLLDPSAPSLPLPRSLSHLEVKLDVYLRDLYRRRTALGVWVHVFLFCFVDVVKEMRGRR